MSKVNQFNCRKCGSNDLSQKKWVSCEVPVVFQENRFLEYLPSHVDESDDLGGVGGFICRSCKTPLYYRGCCISNEEDLFDYLSLTEEERQEQEQLYQATLLEQAQEMENKQEAEVESFIIAEKIKSN